MRKQIVSLALVGGLGAGVGALAVPGIASAADTVTGGATAGVADRVAHIKDALKGLVTNGTITQAQADKVASTLATQLPPPPGRHGMRGPGGPLSPETIAKAMGITVDQLRAGHEAGQTLAQIAAAHGVSKADLISKLVAAAKAQLAADVTAKRITQAQADAISSNLTARITEMVDRVGGPHGPGGGDHDGDGPGDGDGGAPPAISTAPSTTTPSASSSSTA